MGGFTVKNDALEKTAVELIQHRAARRIKGEEYLRKDIDDAEVVTVSELLPSGDFYVSVLVHASDYGGYAGSPSFIGVHAGGGKITYEINMLLSRYDEAPRAYTAQLMSSEITGREDNRGGCHCPGGSSNVETIDPRNTAGDDDTVHVGDDDDGATVGDDDLIPVGDDDAGDDDSSGGRIIMFCRAASSVCHQEGYDSDFQKNLVGCLLLREGGYRVYYADGSDSRWEDGPMDEETFMDPFLEVEAARIQMRFDPPVGDAADTAEPEYFFGTMSFEVSSETLIFGDTGEAIGVADRLWEVRRGDETIATISVDGFDDPRTIPVTSGSIGYSEPLCTASFIYPCSESGSDGSCEEVGK